MALLLHFGAHLDHDLLGELGGPLVGPLHRITFGGGVFVAVGGHVPSASSRNIAISTDGLTWTGTNSGLDGVLYGVTYGNGTFVAVGALGCGQSLCGFIESSADSGVTWTRRETTPRWLTAATYGNGTFVVVGDNGTILTSVDAVNWTGRSSGTTNYLLGVAYGNRTFVAVGPDGIIVQSGDIAVPCLSGRRSTNGDFEVTITGEIGRGYRLQATTNLAATNWVDLLHFTNAQPATQFLDTTSRNFTHRFYRAVSP